MRRGRCGALLCLSDDKLHPKPLFANWLRPSILDVGPGVESVVLAQLRLVLADERCVEISPLEHRQTVFLSTFASESTGEEPTIGSVSAQVITNSGHAGPRVGSESALTKIWLREIHAQEGPDDKPFNP